MLMKLYKKLIKPCQNFKMERKIRHFLDLNLIDTKSIKELLNLGHRLKSSQSNLKFLEKKILAMIFEKPSTRTRISFEIGMKQLGGEVITLDQQDTQLGQGESIQDTIKVLSQYSDIIMYRGTAQKRLDDIVSVSNVPIINGLTDSSHPCQIMADIMTLEEKFDSLNDKNITWIGDGNNVCNSWIHACKHFDFNFRICTPIDFKPKFHSSKKIKFFEDPKEAVKGTNVVITDTWLSMGMKDQDQRLTKFKGFQVNEELMNFAKDDAVFLHCLPAHRGEEVTDDVIDNKNSLVWKEAFNRLHIQKAILLWSLYMDF